MGETSGVNVNLSLLSDTVPLTGLFPLSLTDTLAMTAASSTGSYTADRVKVTEVTCWRYAPLTGLVEASTGGVLSQLAIAVSQGVAFTAP